LVFDTVFDAPPIGTAFGFDPTQGLVKGSIAYVFRNKVIDYPLVGSVGIVPGHPSGEMCYLEVFHATFNVRVGRGQG
jgi:hypothetical protein